MRPAPIVLVPVNRLDRAKGRLAALLTQEQREGLALATLRSVLAAIAGADLEAWVLTGDLRVEAASAPAHCLPEDRNLRGLNPQLERGLTVLAEWHPATPVLILHADLPLATAGALRDLVAAAPAEPSVTLVRSRDGGTNAMLLAPPGRFALAYGPGSYELHTAAARQAGFTIRTVIEESLALDLDTPADVHTLLAHPSGPASTAGRYLLQHVPELR